ncbi:MAG: 1-deoxy-D-xylulose-5-phosphate reductoisomerase [Thermoanaerobaculia bacterium]|nr:1-deoxy-D-xylulose-5-phosphate reductoisomerase [Thermoanaerobaculia bacterium]
MRQRLALLGATGSIGRSCLEVVRHHPERFELVAVGALGSRPDELVAVAREFRPRELVVVDPAAAAAIRPHLPAGTRLAVGEDALVALAVHPDVDRLVGAIVGAAGLRPVHAALSAGKDVALANKESLVVAGKLLTGVAAATGATLLPIDSEHVALHQALRAGRPEEVERLVLTASGGPFLRRDPATFGAIRADEALKHPTWSMGAKISIDSATLVNKGLELIEAHWLFGLPAERIDVVVHPQSIVHSLVEWRDGSWIAQLAPNDMIFPIQYALAYPDRWANRFPRLEPAALGSLEFLPLDRVTFPAVDLARAALAAGDSAPAVFNAANEVAVHAFLDGRIRFPRIVATVERVLARHQPAAVVSLDEALAWDAWGRREAAAGLGD